MGSVRGIRGATTVAENEREAILAATAELLKVIVDRNDLCTADVASAVFTMTPDLDAVFPAAAARALGWSGVPLFCAREIPVPDAPAMCIRVLLHVNTDKTQSEMKHVYLRKAVHLRPDLID